MSLVELGRDGNVFILTMAAGENRFDPAFLDAFGAALDTVEQSSGPAALVTTGAAAKFYSNGLNLDWMLGEGQAEGPAFVARTLRLLGRMLGFPIPTVAAINGHAFAAGGMLALAHDFRVMRVDRGFFCFPEVDLKLPLAPGMLALIRTRLGRATFRDSILTGARIGGEEAHRRGIIDEAVAADQVVSRAVARAAALAEKDRGIYATLKRAMYADAIAALSGGTLA